VAEGLEGRLRCAGEDAEQECVAPQALHDLTQLGDGVAPDDAGDAAFVVAGQAEPVRAVLDGAQAQRLASRCCPADARRPA
jgi:hypothetical protein